MHLFDHVLAVLFEIGTQRGKEFLAQLVFGYAQLEFESGALLKKTIVFHPDKLSPNVHRQIELG